MGSRYGVASIGMDWLYHSGRSPWPEAARSGGRAA